MFRAWLAGLAEFRHHRTLRITGITFALTSLAQGMFPVLFVVFVTGPLAGGEAEVGLLRGVQAIGGLAAGVLIATLARHAAPTTLMGIGMLGVGLVSVVIWNLPRLTTAPWIYLVLFSAVGVPVVLSTSGSLAVIQTSAAPERAGRVLATMFAGMAGCQTVGTLAAGAFAGVWHLDWLLNIHSALFLAAGTLALIFLRRPTPTRPDRDRADVEDDAPEPSSTSAATPR